MADDEKKFTQAEIDAAVKSAMDKRDKDEEGLRSKVDELLAESKAAKKAKAEADEKAAEAARKAAEDGGDIEAVKKSYEDKIDKINADHATEIAGLNGALSGATREAQATAMAAQIATEGNERHIRRDILDRLAHNVVDGKSVVSVLDKDGKPSAASLDELKAEIMADPTNKSIVRASDASGGGAPNADGGAGGLKRSEMSSKDKADYIEKHGQEKYLALPKE